jgi:alpha-tubulin suppressor-like RCC1 family protein
LCRGEQTTPAAAANPPGTGYSQIFTSSESMVALKADGSLVAWGNSATGGSSAPTGTGFVTITANATAFAALKGDGSLWAWGNSTNGGLQPTLPTNNSYTAIYSNPNGFAALRADGTIATWGNTVTGDVPFTGGNNFVSIASNSGAFAALRADGTIRGDVERPLERLDGLRRAGVDGEVEQDGAEGFVGHLVESRLDEVSRSVDVAGFLDGQVFHVRRVHHRAAAPVGERGSGDAELGGIAPVGRMIDEAALALDDRVDDLVGGHHCLVSSRQ